VPAWQPLSLAAPAGAAGSSGSVLTTAGQRKAVRQAAAAAAVARREWYSRSIEIDAAPFAGKTVTIGVKAHGPKGRDDGWSFVTLEVVPPLPVPQNLVVKDVKNAVHLEWAANASQFRIFRKRTTDGDWTQIGESTRPSFDDATAGYGTAWDYSAVSVRQAGEKWIESERSATASFTPKDRFAPEQPGGLSAIAGAATIELSWNSVQDTDVAGYRVYRGGVRIADGLQAAVYSDKDVSAGSRYVYEVSAVDQAGNESVRSAAAEVTMQ
jgi:fibronectin type 3 domain-containing protein